MGEGGDSSDPLKIQLKTVVRKANGFLGDLEEHLKNATKPFEPTLNKAKELLSEVTGFTKDVVDRRHEYGGLLTAGAAGISGTTTFLRRWRVVPAVASAAVAGTVTYGLVYGLDEIFETDVPSKRK